MLCENVPKLKPYNTVSSTLGESDQMNLEIGL